MAWSVTCKQCHAITYGRVVGRIDPYLDDIDIPDNFVWCSICAPWCWDWLQDKLADMDLSLIWRND